MKTYRLYFSLALFAMGVFSSCSSSGKEGMKDIMSMPVHQIETMVQHNQQELITGNPWEFHRVGDNFLVFNGMSNSAALVFRVPDCRLLGEFMPKGMGPGECLRPRYAGCNAEEDTVYIYDSGKHKMFEFWVPSLQMDTLQYKLVNEVRSSHLALNMAACRLDNGLSVSMAGSGRRHLFTLYNERMDSLCTFGSLPFPIEDDELKNFIHLQGVLIAEGSTVYFGCKGLPYLCAYEVNGKDDIQLKFAHNYLPTPYSYSDRIAIDYSRNTESFRDIKINGDYIWATFLGCSANEVIEDPEGRGYADLLLVFDKKDGLPLAKFKFPHKGGHICFSKDGKDLYHFTTDMNIDVVKVDELLDMIN